MSYKDFFFLMTHVTPISREQRTIGHGLTTHAVSLISHNAENFAESRRSPFIILSIKSKKKFPPNLPNFNP
jgi:hypothetical protein